MLKAYAIGFFSAVVTVLLAAAIWLALQPRQEAGLLWGGTVYTSRQEFNGYLKANGLSYRAWLARNPGAAPWEPAARAPAGVKARRAAPSTPTHRAVEDWAARLPPAEIGLLLATGGALLLFLWRLRLLLARIPARSMTFAAPPAGGNKSSVGRPAALAAIRRLGVVAPGAARSLEASVPRYAKRLLDGLRADVRLLRSVMRERDISFGDVAFGLLAVITAGVFGLFVVLLLSV